MTNNRMDGYLNANQEFAEEARRQKVIDSMTFDVLLLSGTYSGREVYQLMLWKSRDYFTESYDASNGNKNDFLQGVSKKFARIITDKNLGKEFRSSQGILIVNKQPRRVPVVDSRALELMLKAELKNSTKPGELVVSTIEPEN